MSDTSTNKFSGYGTNAERLAFTPSPATIAAAPHQLYIWYTTDTNKLWGYDTGWHDLSATAGTGDVVGPASVTDARVVLFDGTTGKLIKQAAAQTGTGAPVFATSPTFVTPALGTPSSGVGTNLTGIPTTALLAGAVVQVVNTQTGAVATGTTAIPIDDTIPQNTEGDEYMTLAITPKSATNKLKIEVVVVASSSVEAWLAAALFQDTTAGALAAARGYATTALSGQTLTFTHYMTTGTTSSTTFKIRAGKGASGTFTFNGSSGTRQFGGVMASSITITEIAV